MNTELIYHCRCWFNTSSDNPVEMLFSPPHSQCANSFRLSFSFANSCSRLQCSSHCGLVGFSLQWAVHHWVPACKTHISLSYKCWFFDIFKWKQSEWKYLICFITCLHKQLVQVPKWPETYLKSQFRSGECLVCYCSAQSRKTPAALSRCLRMPQNDVETFVDVQRTSSVVWLAASCWNLDLKKWVNKRDHDSWCWKCVAIISKIIIINKMYFIKLIDMNESVATDWFRSVNWLGANISLSPVPSKHE